MRRSGKGEGRREKGNHDAEVLPFSLPSLPFPELQ